jgi:hypothetical protein
MRLGAFLENGAGEERFTLGRPCDSHELAAQIQELQIEMIARSRSAIRTDAEAFFTNVALGVGASQIYEKKVLSSLSVVHVPVWRAEKEPVQVKDARHVARTNAKDGALGLLVDRLNLHTLIAPLDPEHALDVREDITLRRVSRIGQMHLNPAAVGVGHRIEAGVPLAPAEWRHDLVPLRPQEVNDLEDIRAINEPGFHALSFSTRTGTICRPFPLVE